MIKLAAIQVAASPDFDRNLKKAAQYLEAAAQRGARVACFPELFAHPWFLGARDDGAFSLAEPADGLLFRHIAEQARTFGIAVVCPFFERSPDGRFFNSAVLVADDGRRVGLYRKVHVPDIPRWLERAYFAPGDLGFPVFEVGGLRVGIQLGWDNFFPEGFRCLALAGAQLVVVPTAAAYASQERWLALAVSHAVANGVYVLRVNRVGRESAGEENLDFYGHSFCVRPDGELSAEPIGNGEGILMVDCEPSEVELAKRTWPFLRDRRPRQYAQVAGIPWGPELLPPEDET